ncbi:MAG: AmmeMemoRadiSam system radical SAM enzyme [Rubrobacteridae bacterium]|nr:AmmeMemoRadiSam system radical SAM enzyme [Rubrobacteridae bacterium]
MSVYELHEASYYEKREENRVKCILCPQLCLIEPGESGFCFIRKNIDGMLFAMEFGRVSSANLDPIEKKPLNNYYPGSTIFSIGGIGCNLRCPWCQNWSIAQPRDSFSGLSIDEITDRFTYTMEPEKVVELAKSYRQDNCIGVAFTYNEPFIWHEYVMEVAKLVKAEGMSNILVTNGYVMPEPLRDLLPYVDAMNIDIKGISEKFYRRLQGHIGPVLKTAETAKKYCHIEITNLIIPGLNDSKDDIKKLVDWIAGALGADTPLHFSRYFPTYKANEPSTGLDVLYMAEKIAREKLEFVYLGNI